MAITGEDRVFSSFWEQKLDEYDEEFWVSYTIAKKKCSTYMTRMWTKNNLQISITLSYDVSENIMTYVIIL